MIALCGITLIVAVLFVTIGILFNFVYTYFYPPPPPGAESDEDIKYHNHVQRLLGRMK